jgi:hypothetical protein
MLCLCEIKSLPKNCWQIYDIKVLLDITWMRLKIIYFLRFDEEGIPYHLLLGPHLRRHHCLLLVDCCAIVAATISVAIAATTAVAVAQPIALSCRDAGMIKFHL